VEHLTCKECIYALCYDCFLLDKHPHCMYFIRKETGLEVPFGKNGNKSIVYDTCSLCKECMHPFGWKCLMCNDVRLCEKCLCVTRGGMTTETKGLFEKAAKLSHDICKHILLKLPVEEDE
jgi:hypothetical protein